jgi:hypothetical protein
MIQIEGVNQLPEDEVSAVLDDVRRHLRAVRDRSCACVVWRG